jgi:hypothetical protein
VREVIKAGPSIRFTAGRAEGTRYVGAFLDNLSRSQGMGGRGARRLLSTRRGARMLTPVQDQLQRAADQDADVVMTSSGSLAHIYFAQEPDNLCLEEIESRYPGLIAALVAHEGIGQILIRCKDRGPVVMSKQGICELAPNGECVIEGDDPISEFGEHAPSFFRRLAEYEYAGDIVVNGSYDPEKRWVVGFDDLVGAHGGFGGPQTQPFLIFPTGWTADEPQIVGSVALHKFLRRHTAANEAEAQGPLEDDTLPTAERLTEIPSRPEQRTDDVA